MNEFSFSKRRRGRPPASTQVLDSSAGPLFAEVLPVGRPVSSSAWVAEVVLPSGALVRLAANAPSAWVRQLLRSC